MSNDLKDELFNVLSGKSEVRFGTIIQAITSYLKDGDIPSSGLEDEKHFKKQEAKRLEDFTKLRWICNPAESSGILIFFS